MRPMQETLLRKPVLLTGSIGLVLLAGSWFFFLNSYGQNAAGDNTSAAGTSSEEDKLPGVQAVKVERKDIQRTIEVPGWVEGYETADLYTKVGGPLKEMAVDIGDRITKDQPLAKLYIPEMQKELELKNALIEQANADVKQAKAAITQATANVQSATALVTQVKTERGDKLARLSKSKVDFDRIKYLVDRGALEREKLDAAQFDLESAQAALATVDAKIKTAEADLEAAKAQEAKAKADHQSALARVNVASADAEYVKTMNEYATLRAPFDGVVIKRWMHPGAYVHPAEGNSSAKPLLTVTRTDKLRIFVSLPMSEVRWLDEKDTAVVRVESLPDEKFKANVTRYSPALNEMKTMRVELGLEKHDPRIIPGSYVYVDLHLVGHPQTPVIPASALLSDKKGKFVYEIVEGLITRRPVITLYEDGKIVGIADGLEGGEVVVRTGGGQVAPGQKVQPVQDSK